MTSPPGRRVAWWSARGGPAVTIALVTGTLYVVLTVLVMAHLTDPLDAAAREWFRPDDVWGSAQVRADVVVEGLKPSRIAPVLALAAVAGGLARRSWRQPMVALQVGLSALVLVLTTKLLVGRPDTHGDVATGGGSFPSGHTAVLLAVLGGCLLALTTADGWWAWSAVVLVDMLMGLCLLLQATHWFTDILGGMLLAGCVLAVASMSRPPRTPEPVSGSPPQPSGPSAGPASEG